MQIKMGLLLGRYIPCRAVRNGGQSSDTQGGESDFSNGGIIHPCSKFAHSLFSTNKNTHKDDNSEGPEDCLNCPPNLPRKLSTPCSEKRERRVNRTRHFLMFCLYVSCFTGRELFFLELKKNKRPKKRKESHTSLVQPA